MRKMPCIFVRDFSDKSATITSRITPGCEWVLAGEGMPYIKRDGTACAVIDGALYRRFDAKHGKPTPAGAIPCDPEPDAKTGHWPHWLPVGNDAADKWHREAWILDGPAAEGTHELCGPHYNGNPERLVRDMFIKHDSEPLSGELVERPSFDGLREALFALNHEGIVFHHPDGRMAKIRRADFGFEWRNR